MPGRTMELMDLDDLKPHPENPKAHDLKLISSSVDRFGFVEPIIRDERTGYIISGHGRVEVLAKLRDDPRVEAPEGVVIEDGRWRVPVVRGWSSRSDAEARALLVALNQIGPAGAWDQERLASVLQLTQADQLLGLTGFCEGDLKRLLTKPEPSGATLLRRSDVTIGEPTHRTNEGDHWVLGGRHHLVVADLIRGWPTWAPLLQGDRLFVPYPGPYAAISQAALNHDLVLVQPEPYLAGHLLDKFVAIAGEDEVKAA